MAYKPQSSKKPAAPTTVQKITRRNYDLLVPMQKQFYDDLIVSGKAEIVEEIKTGTGETTAAETPVIVGHPRTSVRTEPRVDPVTQKIGHPVMLTLINNSVVSGILKDVYPFELIVAREGGQSDIIILKHSVIFII